MGDSHAVRTIATEEEALLLSGMMIAATTPDATTRARAYRTLGSLPERTLR